MDLLFISTYSMILLISRSIHCLCLLDPQQPSDNDDDDESDHIYRTEDDDHVGENYTRVSNHFSWILAVWKSD
jgi:hypothetical protein